MHHCFNVMYTRLHDMAKTVVCYFKSPGDLRLSLLLEARPGRFSLDVIYKTILSKPGNKLNFEPRSVAFPPCCCAYVYLNSLCIYLFPHMQENAGVRTRISPAPTSSYRRSKPRQPGRELVWCPPARLSDNTHLSSALTERS